MNVDVSMSSEDEKFSVNSWWARTPYFVVAALARQLKAAAAVWPELDSYVIQNLVEQEPEPDGGERPGSEG